MLYRINRLMLSAVTCDRDSKITKMQKNMQMYGKIFSFESDSRAEIISSCVIRILVNENELMQK